MTLFQLWTVAGVRSAAPRALPALGARSLIENLLCATLPGAAIIERAIAHPEYCVRLVKQARARGSK